MPESRHVTTKDNLVAELNKMDEGGTLHISRGHHVVDAPLRNNVDGITVQGEGVEDTVITRAADFPLVELVGTQRRGERRYSWAFRNLTLRATRGDSSDLLYARYGNHHRFENVKFGGDGMTGNGVYAEEVWDVRFRNCEFAKCGDPTEGTADVFFYNGDYDNTNTVKFINCTWGKPTSYAIYSDSSGRGSVNDRFYLANCKILGEGRGGQITDDPERYYIDGSCRGLKVTNSHFRWGLRGFLRNESGGSVQVSNCKFQHYGDVAVNLGSGENIVSNNVFESNRGDSTAVRTTVPGNSILGNRIDDENGLTVEGDRTAVNDNAFTTPTGDGITVDADDCVVRGNIIRDPGGDGIAISGNGAIVSSNRCVDPSGSGIAFVDSRYGIVTGNAIRDPGDEAIASSGDSDCLFVTTNMCVGGTSPGVSLAGQNDEVGTNFIEPGADG